MFGDVTVIFLLFIVWFHGSQGKHCNFTSFWDSDDMSGRCFVINVRVPVAVYFFYFIFWSIFSLSFRLGNFYYPLFQFTDSSSFPLHFSFEPIHWLFLLVTICEVLQFTCESSLYLFLCWESIFKIICFKCVFNDLAKHCVCVCVLAAIKPLPGKLSLSVIAVLASTHSIWGLPGSWHHEWFLTETWILGGLHYTSLGLIYIFWLFLTPEWQRTCGSFFLITAVEEWKSRFPSDLHSH